jgi:hypothetical protein
MISICRPTLNRVDSTTVKPKIIVSHVFLPLVHDLMIYPINSLLNNWQLVR